MSEDETLQQQIADIGIRYLRRTLHEIDGLRARLRDAQGGSSDALGELARMAHKIHGSGAMFGFDTISERAYEIETLARDDDSPFDRIATAVAGLEEEVRAQAQRRGVQ